MHVSNGGVGETGPCSSTARLDINPLNGNYLVSVRRQPPQLTTCARLQREFANEIPCAQVMHLHFR